MIRLISLPKGNPVFVNPAHVSLIQQESQYLRPEIETKVTCVHVAAKTGNVLCNIKCIPVEGTVDDVAALFQPPTTSAR